MKSKQYNTSSEHYSYSVGFIALTVIGLFLVGWVIGYIGAKSFITFQDKLNQQHNYTIYNVNEDGTLTEICGNLKDKWNCINIKDIPVSKGDTIVINYEPYNPNSFAYEFFLNDVQRNCGSTNLKFEFDNWYVKEEIGFNTYKVRPLKDCLHHE